MVHLSKEWEISFQLYDKVLISLLYFRISHMFYCNCGVPIEVERLISSKSSYEAYFSIFPYRFHFEIGVISSFNNAFIQMSWLLLAPLPCGTLSMYQGIPNHMF